MSKPIDGIINVELRDSTPDWEPFLRPQAPEGAPNVLRLCGMPSATA
jgi:arylsulfatase